MVDYVVISRKAGEPIGNNDKMYGICACEKGIGYFEIINCIYGISEDLPWIKDMADRLNRNDVDPIHLSEIVDDEIELRHLN